MNLLRRSDNRTCNRITFLFLVVVVVLIFGGGGDDIVVVNYRQTHHRASPSFKIIITQDFQK